MSRPVLRIEFLALGLAQISPTIAQAEQPPADQASAQAAYEAGDFAMARRILEALVAASPQDPDLLRRLAAAQAAAGDLAAAQGSIDTAESLAPGDPDIQLARANILLWRGNLPAARASADELAWRRPDYPGLSELDAAVGAAERARRLRLQSVAAGASLSQARFASGGETTWSVQQAAVVLGWDEGKRASLEIEREDRGAVDTRLSGRIDWVAGDHALYLSASATPAADFREDWSLGGGGEVKLSERTRLLAGLRYAAYSGKDVGILRLGVRRQLSEAVSLTGEAIQLFGSGADYRVGGTVRADYQPSEGPSLFLIAASYPDTEVDGTRQLRSAAIGTAIPLGSGLSLRLTGEYENRNDSSERTSVNAGISWSLGR